MRPALDSNETAEIPIFTDQQSPIVWYENGDFSLHYHETHETGAFDHRWDRHPSGHNARDHVHPGPDAPTPGDDTTHPTDWRDVLSTVLSEIEDRQRGFWTGPVDALTWTDGRPAVPDMIGE